MYNAERKLAFIEDKGYSPSSKRDLISKFEGFSVYEEKFGKDLSQMDIQELQVAFDSVSGIGRLTVRQMKSILKNYVRWCKSEGLQTTDSILHIRLDSDEKISQVRDTMVKSPSHLKSIMDEGADGEPIFAPAEKETMDIVYRTFYWMAFAGMSDKDALLVRTANIDFKNRQIVYDGVRYELYEEGLEDVKKAATLNDFWYEHPNYGVRRRKRTDGDLLLRGFTKGTPNLIQMRNGSPKGMGGSDSRKWGLTYRRILESGIFYRAREFESVGKWSWALQMFTDVILRDLKSGRIKIPDGKDFSYIEKIKKKHYIEEYERWKLAFYG